MNNFKVNLVQVHQLIAMHVMQLLIESSMVTIVFALPIIMIMALMSIAKIAMLNGFNNLIEIF